MATKRITVRRFIFDPVQGEVELPPHWIPFQVMRVEPPVTGMCFPPATIEVWAYRNGNT